MLLRTRQTGFTLIEIMIVVAIVAILAAIAYPAYTDQVRKARRADAKAALMELSQAAERYYTQNGTYVGYALAFTESPKESGIKFYDLAINPAATAQTFTITATPKAGQASDPCGTLTINQVGAKTATGGNADCWAR